MSTGTRTTSVPDGRTESRAWSGTSGNRSTWSTDQVESNRLCRAMRDGSTNAFIVLTSWAVDASRYAATTSCAVAFLGGTGIERVGAVASAAAAMISSTASATKPPTSHEGRGLTFCSGLAPSPARRRITRLARLATTPNAKTKTDRARRAPTAPLAPSQEDPLPDPLAPPSQLVTDGMVAETADGSGRDRQCSAVWHEHVQPEVTSRRGPSLRGNRPTPRRDARAGCRRADVTPDCRFRAWGCTGPAWRAGRPASRRADATGARTARSCR